jgi:hypothetical protein
LQLIAKNYLQLIAKRYILDSVLAGTYYENQREKRKKNTVCLLAKK